MLTGHVRAPLIVPLRLPIEGQHKNSIDSSTQVEISTDTPLARVYFTIDGSRPDPTSWKPHHPQSGPTYLFERPFTLPPGIKTIKAIAFISLVVLRFYYLNCFSSVVFALSLRNVTLSSCRCSETNQESNVVTKTLDVLADSRESVNGNELRPRSVDYDFLDEFKNDKTKVSFSTCILLY